MKPKMMIATLTMLLLTTMVVFAYSESKLKLGETNYPNDTIGPDTVLGVQLNELNPEFVLIEIPAKFPGGEDAMETYFINNVSYPLLAQSKGIEGKIDVRFVVTANGEIENVEILNEIGGGCEQEIMDALYNMPLWEPKIQAGHKVHSKNSFSFTFKL